MDRGIIKKYGNKVRVRACGLCWKGDKLLMVNHRFLTNGNFWAPPGGGIEFGQSAHDTLIREFQEEVKITINPGPFQFVCELLQNPLHAIELFFEVVHEEGEPSLGSDPESAHDKQILTEVLYMDFKTIQSIPHNERHGIFRFVKSADELKKLTGFYRL